jgi:hypothetical protein
MKMIGRGDLLFVHHAISDTLTTPGVQTNIFNEAVLPKKELEKHFELIVGGHIHHPQSGDKTIVAGSIFNNECGEKEKLIWKIHLPTAKQKIKIESIPLPGRGIYKVESGRDSILKQLEKIPVNSIVKAVITTREELKEIEDIKKILQKFDAYILLEQIPDKRKKIHLEENKNLLNFTLNELLEVYAKERKVSLTQLQQGLSLIQ